METMTNMKAIRTFFEADGGRKFTIGELKALPNEYRAELGALAAEKLGVKIAESPAV